MYKRVDSQPYPRKMVLWLTHRQCVVFFCRKSAII